MTEYNFEGILPKQLLDIVFTKIGRLYRRAIQKHNALMLVIAGAEL